jgi:hypothetical protein
VKSIEGKLLRGTGILTTVTFTSYSSGFSQTSVRASRKPNTIACNFLLRSTVQINWTSAGQVFSFDFLDKKVLVLLIKSA